MGGRKKGKWVNEYDDPDMYDSAIPKHRHTWGGAYDMVLELDDGDDGKLTLMETDDSPAIYLGSLDDEKLRGYFCFHTSRHVDLFCEKLKELQRKLRS